MKDMNSPGGIVRKMSQIGIADGSIRRTVPQKPLEGGAEEQRGVIAPASHGRDGRDKPHA